MAVCNETLVSPPAESGQQLNLEAIRSRIQEISERPRTCLDFSEISSSESERLLQECLHHLTSNFQKIESEFSDISSLGLEDLDVYLERLKRELSSAEAENALISNEIDALTGTFIKDSIQLESELEGLGTSLKFFDSQDGIQTGYSILGESQGSQANAHEDYNFKILELDHLLEKSNTSLNSLLDLEYVFKRAEAIGQIEGLLSDLKVIEFDGNCIRLAMKTSFPTLESLSCLQKLDFANEPSVLDHELLIELEDGTMQLKNVEIFPNDVYIGEVIDAAKSLRLSLSSLSHPAVESSLEWLVRKVQLRIFLCALRRLIVKDAEKSRHSFDYSDKDETVIVHLVGNIDAFIKIAHSWPLSTSPLKLVSLKNSDFHSKGISLSLICKIQELANSIDEQRRSQLLSFADAIEEILIQQKHLEP
ncbi:hypothetical protein AAC387_Pa08g1406 [Persea americana]